MSERYVTDAEAAGWGAFSTVHLVEEGDGATVVEELHRLLDTREAAVGHLRAVVDHVRRNADMEYESPTVREARAFLASLAPTPTEEPEDE